MDIEDLRLAVYGRFRGGTIPRVADLARDLSTTQEHVATGLAMLADQRHLALGPDGEITMAHPFTAVPLGFSVMGRSTLWWGGCAWDSFALPHLLPEAWARSNAGHVVATSIGPCSEHCGHVPAQCGLTGAFWGLQTE